MTSRVGPFIVKMLASGAVVAGAATFLAMFGPRVEPVVHADIYAPLARAAGFLLPPPGGGPPLRLGTALVNGQRFNYAIGHSRLRVDDVLDHFERQFSAPQPGSIVPRGAAGVVRQPGAGVVSGVRFGDLEYPDDLAARMGRLGQTGRLADFGEFHVVSAFEQNGTIFIDFTPGSGVTLTTLLPAGDADAAGEDVPGVRRPSGVQRLMTIEHGEGATWSRTLIYRARDIQAAVSDFRTAFVAAGWQPNPGIGSQAMFHFSNGRQECYMGAASDVEHDTIVLVYRRLQSGQGSS